MYSVALATGIIIISNLNDFYTCFSFMWINFIFMFPLCYYNPPQILLKKSIRTETKQTHQQTENKQTDWHQMYDWILQVVNTQGIRNSINTHWGKQGPEIVWGLFLPSVT